MKRFFSIIFTLAVYANSTIAHPHQSLNPRHKELEARIGAACTLTPSNPSTFWIGDITHNGTSPFLGNSSYVVYCNVKDFGAVGDGTTDDSDAIQKAIDAGDRCITGCNGGTILKPTLVFFPAGTYKVSKTINMYLHTQLVGDALNWPVIKATSDIGATYVINGFLYVDGVHSTTNFHLQVRNLKIDVTSVASDVVVKCLNWAAAQATSLTNVEFVMSNRSSHIGIVQDGENGGGSGTYMGDLAFRGSAIGFDLSNQQFEFRALTFIGCTTAIKVDHVFVATFQDINFIDCGTAFDAGASGSSGSIAFVDSRATSVDAVFITDKSGNGSGTITIENFEANNVKNIVIKATGDVILAGGTVHVDQWFQGNVYPNNLDQGNYQQGNRTATTRSSALTNAAGAWFTKSRPQYQEYSPSDFTSVKASGAAGDGVTDDTAAINAALIANAGCKITYFPAGTYLVTDTIKVPPGSRLVGEVWSAITGE